MNKQIEWNRQNCIKLVKSYYIQADYIGNSDNFVTLKELREFLFVEFVNKQERIEFLKDLIENLELDKKERAEHLQIDLEHEAFQNDSIQNRDEYISTNLKLNLRFYDNNICHLQGIIDEMQEPLEPTNSNPTIEENAIIDNGFIYTIKKSNITWDGNLDILGEVLANIFLEITKIAHCETTAYAVSNWLEKKEKIILTRKRKWSSVQTKLKNSLKKIKPKTDNPALLKAASDILEKLQT
ncbi:MAG: hypothetical protein HW421_505 [Ignavibacteria bacterium]|nr:hypothetical protein [Ignavibacteria bacterium]